MNVLESLTDFSRLIFFFNLGLKQCGLLVWQSFQEFFISFHFFISGVNKIGYSKANRLKKNVFHPLAHKWLTFLLPGVISELLNFPLKSVLFPV